MVDYSRVFHTGVRVPDIEAAKAEYGSQLGLTWAEQQRRPQQIWTPEGGVRTVDLHFTYSCEGPVHIELLQGEAGTFWDGFERPGAHHIGIWSDDVKGETDALIAAGWTLVGAGAPPEDGYGGMFTYLAPSTGLIVELVNSLAAPMFERWWAGGPMA